MNAPARLVWLPASLCDRVSQELQTLFASYCGLWGLPALVSLQVSREEHGSPLPSAGDRPLDLTRPWPESLRAAVTQALFQRPYAESAILRGVLDRIEQGLQRALADRFATQAPHAGNERGHPGHAGLACDIEWLQCRLRLWLSCDQLRDKGWLDVAPRPSLPRVDIEHALSRTQVRMLARLGSVSVNVGDLLHLSPGDVLLLSETLDEPLRVHSPGSSLMLRALLGSTVSPAGLGTAPRRAIRCLSLQAP